MDLDIKHMVTENFSSQELRKIFLDMNEEKILFVFTLLDNYVKTNDVEKLAQSIKAIA